MFEHIYLRKRKNGLNPLLSSTLATLHHPDFGCVRGGAACAYYVLADWQEPAFITVLRLWTGGQFYRGVLWAHQYQPKKYSRVSDYPRGVFHV